jgi:hypothetical protein
MPVILAIEAMLLPSASIETTVTFFSVFSMFATAFYFVAIIVAQIYIGCKIFVQQLL